MTISCWIGRQSNGLFMLTEQQPVVHNRRRSGLPDLYVPYGDEIGYRNICRDFLMRICPKAAELDRLESIEVEIPEWPIRDEISVESLAAPW